MGPKHKQNLSHKHHNIYPEGVCLASVLPLSVTGLNHEVKCDVFCLWHHVSAQEVSDWGSVQQFGFWFLGLGMLNLFASSMLPMTKSIAKQRDNLNKNVQGPKRRGPKTSDQKVFAYNTNQAEYHVVFTKTALSTLWAKWFFVEARHFLSCDNQTYPGSNCATEVRTHELGTMRTLAERMPQCIQRSASHLTQLQDWRDCSASPSVKTTLTTWQRLTRPRSEKRRKGKNRCKCYLGDEDELIQNNSKRAFPWPAGPCRAHLGHFPSALALTASLAMF